MSTGSALAHFERAKLDNGLRVLVAPDHSSPLVAVAVVYDVGFRSEPEGRSGFAHLFEHLMFQGSAHVGKIEHMQLVQGAGGVINGQTMADLTQYYEALPSGGLELVLWLEADRMGALALTEENLRNQVSVVEEEIKVNVLNRPYGGFPWIPLPGLAFDTYPNAHNGYGDFAHLEQATIEDAKDFYDRYYAPSNAALVVAGDCTPEDVVDLASRHFGRIEARPAPVRRSFAEPRLSQERRKVIHDALIPQPAFAAGYRVPDPVSKTEDYVAYFVLANVLSDGDASRLRSRLVHHDRTVTDLACYLGVFGSDSFTMRDPVLFQVVVFHPGVAGTDTLLAVIDEELERLAAEGPNEDELARAFASAASSHWRGLDQVLNRALALAGAEVVHNRAELVHELPGLVTAVGREAVAAAAAELVHQHRAIVELIPGGGS
ncbi:MAG: M16 family metallopeptidase [Acidimicrobiales bacterium]|jgi:predicted Zn-dependent peptidase